MCHLYTCILAGHFSLFGYFASLLLCFYRDYRANMSVFTTEMRTYLDIYYVCCASSVPLLLADLFPVSGRPRHAFE
jgi:hypothetical protein